MEQKIKRKSISWKKEASYLKRRVEELKDEVKILKSNSPNSLNKENKEKKSAEGLSPIPSADNLKPKVLANKPKKASEDASMSENTLNIEETEEDEPKEEIKEEREEFKFECPNCHKQFNDLNEGNCPYCDEELEDAD
jgi:hypothetical protein